MPDLVARSGVPIIFCPERNISGIMVTSWKSTNQWPLTSYCTGSPTLFGMKVQLKTSFSPVPSYGLGLWLNQIFHLHAASDEEQLPRAHFRHIFNHHIAERVKIKRQKLSKNLDVKQRPARTAQQKPR